MPSLVVIGPQIKEKQRATMCPPAYMVPKDPSLNRVKTKKLLRFHCSSYCNLVTIATMMHVADASCLKAAPFQI